MPDDNSSSIPTDTAVRTERPKQQLLNFPIIATTSLEEARDAVTRIYLPHDLTAANDRINMSLNAFSDRHFTLGYLTYHASTLLDMPPTGDTYHINFTTAGETFAERTDGVRERTAVGRGLILTPNNHHRVSWTPQAEQFILKIPRKSLEAHLGDLLGQPIAKVVDFKFGLDLSTGGGRSLFRTVRFLASELDQPDGLVGITLVREQLEGVVMTQLLHGGKHQYTNALNAPARAERRGRIAPVVDFIKAHADEPLTPQTLARIGGMSVRTLHATFQQVFGESPMNYVRRIRLDYVHAELVRSDASQIRVIDVAMRWGFFHQSRFAQQYRSRFNELPSQTLRS